MVVDSKSQRLYAKIAKPISAVRPWQIPIIKEPPMPHGLPMASSRAAARVSANNAAPGFRTMMAASGPANSQMPFNKPSKPGVTASKSVIGAAQMTSQPQKITPAATAMIAATTMSTTRHLLLCFFTTEDSFTVMNVPFSMSRHGKRETSVRRHYPVYVHTVEALASSQPYGPRVCA